jgi:uncharacterized protein YbjT (DUF2867 family)
MSKPIRAIITGATGMVGEGVLLECLQHPNVEAVLVINRKPGGRAHPKLKEIIHSDFYDLSAIAGQLDGYNACYFCLGSTSVGKTKEVYYKLTYTLTMHVAEILVKQNADMTFCYVSGAGTDSEEKGTGWAATKGKTENALFKLPFKQVFAFRPGFMLPTKGAKNTQTLYKYVSWLFPVGRALYPKGFCKLSELGQAMIKVTEHGYTKKVIEGEDIIAIAKS